MNQENPALDNSGASEPEDHYQSNTSDQLSEQPVPQTSPIRPPHPNPPRPKISPSLTRPTHPAAPSGKAPDELDADLMSSVIEKSEQVVESIRKKMASVAQEYAEGTINKAQFNAIYQRYNEQREITERLLQRNPDSDAWQSVIQPGHTGFLRNYFEAKIISYGLYRLRDSWQITLQGSVRLPQEQLLPIFARIKRMIDQGHKLGPAWRKLKDDNWVFIVPGKLTASVVIFSVEPAIIQRKKVEDAHRDFERANAKILENESFQVESLVFPHRALLR